VIFLEYAVDVASACHELGIATVAVTAGEICPTPRRDFFAAIDAANVDLKAFSETFYKSICGGHLQTVLDTLEFLHGETDVWLEITTLLIPGLNDSDAEVAALSAWVAERLGVDVPLHFTAFHPDWKLLDRPPTPPATLTRARRIALDHGLRYVYTGNVRDVDGASTYCHRCGGLLIGRDGYEMTAWRLNAEAHCEACGEPCAGRFDGPPGDWGARRRPVRLRDFAVAGADSPAPRPARKPTR